VSDAPRCPTCWFALKPGATFCAQCGNRVAAPSSQPASTSMAMRLRGGDVKMVIWYFCLSLAAAAAWMIYARVTEDGFHTFVGGSITLGVLTVIFAITNRSLISEPASRIGFGPLGYLLILVAAVPIVLLVAGYVEVVNAWFGIKVPSELSEFEGKSVIWPILLVVIIPPLEEELAFRGLIYGGLRKSFTVTETFIVSSFAFAILHLSVPSLVTHFPLGMYFVWLRHKSNSLWPGVFAHACHNLGVCILAWVR
jgi:membrane protease YdiL (CAAX protease family)